MMILSTRLPFSRVAPITIEIMITYVIVNYNKTHEIKYMIVNDDATYEEDIYMYHATHLTQVKAKRSSRRYTASNSGLMGPF